MARCKHQFELTAVVCPMGCGGTQKPQKQVAKPQRPRAAQRLKSPNSSFTDDELAKVLEETPTIRAAAGKLGCGLSTLYMRAKKSPALRALYDQAGARGRATSRKLHAPPIRRAAHG